MKTTRSGRLRLPKTLPTTIRLISSVHVHHVCCDIEVNFLILLSVLCLCVIFWFCCFKTERFFFVDFIMQWIFFRSLGWNFRDATVGLKALWLSLVRNSKQVTKAFVSWHLLVANSLESFWFREGSFFNFECPLHRNAIVSYHYLIFYLITFSLCSPILKSKIIQ